VFEGAVGGGTVSKSELFVVWFFELGVHDYVVSVKAM
jgi:hypothetical protein